MALNKLKLTYSRVIGVIYSISCLPIGFGLECLFAVLSDGIDQVGWYWYKWRKCH